MEGMDIDAPVPSRGIKRKADELEAPRRIEALHQDVVNKIAAGEIIVAPVHALKELIENAVDAGSTSLEILVKEGGLRLLQITDNGHGIHRDDLPILCERFTTSKLKSFEDLMAMNTYGFRGEALASISHIAHLSVTTRTMDSDCAWKAQYAAGKLVPAKPGQTAEPKAAAGRQGTQIQVEDLFYNIPNRRRAFRSPSEEYSKISEMVGKYAVHCKTVAFSCKKHGEAGISISVPANASIKDRIRVVYPSAGANDLIELAVESETYGFKATGYVSSVNQNGKKTTLLLFINNRAVESQATKRAFENTYTRFLPKGGKPFIYLSLEIDPARVDVNVHPTKKEVNFLNEDEIIELLCQSIATSLSSVDTSRSFVTQSLLSGGKTPSIARTGSIPEQETPSGLETSARSASSKKPYENNLVRTDARTQKITALLRKEYSADSVIKSINNIEYEYNDRPQNVCRLTAVKDLRSEVIESTHHELTDTIANHTFVGIVDAQKRIAAIQGGVKLYLVDYGLFSAEYFYQLGLTDFANFGSMRFEPPLNLLQLLEAGVMVEQAKEKDIDFDWPVVAPKVAACLHEKRQMLSEYFSLDISGDGELLGLPLMTKGYIPALAKLPSFLLRLGPHVDWKEEKACYRTLLRELASFYAPPMLSGVDDETDELTIRQQVEDVLFPAFKSRLVATRELSAGTVEIANLKGLYRVFERC